MLLYTPPRSTLFPYPTLFRPPADALKDTLDHFSARDAIPPMNMVVTYATTAYLSRLVPNRDRKSTRLNSSHVAISYAVFCLKKKKENLRQDQRSQLYSSASRR